MLPTTTVRAAFYVNRAGSLVFRARCRVARARHALQLAIHRAFEPVSLFWDPPVYRPPAPRQPWDNPPFGACDCPAYEGLHDTRSPDCAWRIFPQTGVDYRDALPGAPRYCWFGCGGIVSGWHGLCVSCARAHYEG